MNSGLEYAARPEVSGLIDARQAPVVSAVGVEFPPNRHRQEDVMAALIGELGSDFICSELVLLRW